MKQVAIYNNQAFGDCLLGTHTASLYKQRFPDHNITFLVRENLKATTSETENQLEELIEVLELQNGIDNVGVISHDGRIQSKHPITESFYKIIVQDKWFSDLGIVKSQSYELLSDEHFSNTETKFNVLKAKNLPTDRLVIVTCGPLDWNRKLSNETTRVNTLNSIINFLKNNNIRAEIKMLGKDVDNMTILESLQCLNNSHLYIGPMGMYVHAAAGLGVDTIHVTSVYPPEYDSPKFYHSGWHRPVIGKIHCGTYACVSEKLSSTQVYPEGPQTKMGFWPKKCEITQNKMSCVYNTNYYDIFQTFIEWCNTVGIHKWSQ